MNKQTELIIENNQLLCKGSWTTTGIASIQKLSNKEIDKLPEDITIDGSDIMSMDTAGAWFLFNIIETLESFKKHCKLVGLSEEHQHLISLIKKSNQEIQPLQPLEKLDKVEKIGKGTIKYIDKFIEWLAFIGELFMRFCVWIVKPQKIRWKYFLNIIDTNGFRALPIVGFLSFLIGVVLTYQTGLQLRLYGANSFIISLLGIAVFREFGPLITAIILAGRTGSAFTAQIGIMKTNEEVDALRTMGHSPIDLLVLPRILGLIIAMPLLVVWADIFGILGGMVMSKSILSITYSSFLQQFPANVTLTSFMIGLGKAPVFALIIAAVGCFHGFRVSGSSESIGFETTKSVVLAIFMIIIADAGFSILFSWLGI